MMDEAEGRFLVAVAKYGSLSPRVLPVSILLSYPGPKDLRKFPHH